MFYGNTVDFRVETFLFLAERADVAVALGANGLEFGLETLFVATSCGAYVLLEVGDCIVLRLYDGLVIGLPKLM